ncbi:MAG: hypothetical protein KA140_07335 [Caldisericia bacterium]|nr:hypothetical protein [Caldisericia bacterium]
MIEGLWVFGNGNRDDSLGVCLRYALSRFGLGASQSWVDGMTGMAFSLPLLHNEDCMAWWMEGWNDINVHSAATALGLKLETEFVKSDKSSDTYLARPRTFWQTIKEKIKSGHVVIENTWPLATVIDSWDEEIDRPERVCFSGFPIYPNPHGQFHVISRSTFTQDREESARVAIEFGLELLDGKHDTDIVKYGDTILEAVKIHLKKEFFCQACKDDDFGCFTRTLSRIRGQRLSLMWFAQETKGIQGSFARRMSELAEEAERISTGIHKMLYNSELEKLWKDKQKIIEMLPF